MDNEQLTPVFARTGARMSTSAKPDTPRKLTPSSEMVSLRVPGQKLAVIDVAADIVGKSRTQFVLETTLERAERVILDQRSIPLDEAQADALEALFRNPPKPVEALRRLMMSKAPWE